MRVVIVGATGNVGTSLVKLLGTEDRVREVVGLARRRPQIALPKTEWRAADVVTDDLTQHFDAADAVVHLAWTIQPSHDLRTLHSVNVVGSQRVFDAVARAGVSHLVYASSIGTYSAGPKSTKVDERWPAEGVPSSFYARHKAEVERRLDVFETDHPDVRVVRLRPALIFKKEAATGIKRLFLGPLVPGPVLAPSRLPFAPSIRRLVFQALHTEDAADAYRLALVGDARGAFNLAADPVIDADELARLLDARKVPVPAGLVRFLMLWSWRFRLQPSPPGWFDMGVETPLIDTTKAFLELGWKPRHTSVEALLELLEGFAEGASFDTPPLAR